MAVSLVLAIIGWTLAGIIGLLLLLLLLLLFLPLDVHLRLDSDLSAPGWEEELQGSLRWLLRLRWGRVVYAGEWEGESFTILRSDQRLLGIRLRSKARRAKKEKAKKERKRKRSLDLELILAYIEESVRFLGRSWQDLGVQFTGTITYGFPDPALTGWCEGIRWGTGLRIPIHLTADFQRPCLTGWSEANGRTYGFKVAAAALKALRNPVIRNRLAERIRFKPLRYLLVRGG